MESFFDLSLSLAINNQTVSKQANKMSATKKKQPPAQVSKKKNSTEKVDKETEEKPKKQLPAQVTDRNNSTEKVDKETKEKPKKQLQAPVTDKKNSSKKADKTTKEKPKPPPSKYQLKKMKKETKKSKKKGRRRLNSTSSTGKKQSEVDEDVHTDEDENENPNNDVIETSADDVIETSADDVTENSVDDVTGTSVEEDVTSVTENELIDLAKVDDRVKSEPVVESSDSDFDINKIRDCATSQHDVIDTSPDGVTATSGDDENVTHDSRILNLGEESSSIHSDKMHNSEENKDFTESSNEDNTMKNEKNMDVLSEEPLVNGGDLSESSQSSENINGISKNEEFGTPVQNNEISSENQIRDSDDGKICCGGALDAHDCKTESLLQSNGEDVLNSSDKQQKDCQNNEISSENILGGSESGINGKTGCIDASDGKDCKNESLLHSNTADVPNSTDEGQTLCYTSPISHNLSNGSDNDVVLAENKTGLPIDNKAEYICPNCETSDMNDICVNSIQIKSTGLSQDGDAGGINSEESNQIPASEIANGETGQALENKLSNLSLESNKGNSNRSHESPAFVIKFENDDADKLTQDKLSNLSTDNNRGSSNGSHEDPVSFNKTVETETHETTGSESDDFTGNKSTVLPQNGDGKNSKENKNVLDYVNQIVDDILESCFHKISTSLSEEANKMSRAKFETDMSFECKKIKEEYNSPANISPKENDFKKTMCKDEFKSSVNDSAFSQTDEEKIQEYVKKIVDDAVKQCLLSDATTTRHDNLSKFENFSKDETSDSRNIENDPENLESVPGTENVSAISRSEILRGNHSLGSMEAIKPNVMSVESCLKRFCSPEILDGDNMFICEQCNQNNTEEEEEEEETNDEDEKEDSDDDKDTTSEKKTKRKPIYTEAVKQLLINEAPPIFTLHLKRFHQVGYSLKKIPKHVDFPLLLDIAPFCHKSSKLATDSEGKVLYSLFGIVEHSGSLHSGHYTAYCRVPTVPSSLFETKFENLTQLLNIMDQMWTQGDKRESYVHEGLSSSRWFYISDSHVSEVGLDRVLKAQAYLLFYERMVLSHSGEIENTAPKTVTE
ncbi:ubiquitin carboxyl-terminal hydrolase 16-like [Paramuricea clavata]|uniref:Ubiquitin carboxyl-terminal hydrolase 16-like n=2 Tax=Paramuricea clavata TaxID=317549 RepID=A0A7D9DR46_PARCT|nr:ubiquitin carboxyl-terminal hydrolase 16-like [Paramuricea clavata]